MGDYLEELGAGSRSSGSRSLLGLLTVSAPTVILRRGRRHFSTLPIKGPRARRTEHVEYTQKLPLLHRMELADLGEPRLYMRLRRADRAIGMNTKYSCLNALQLPKRG